MKDRLVWFIKITTEDNKSGIGEIAPITNLSPDVVEDIPEELEKVKIKLLEMEVPKSKEEVWESIKKLTKRNFPSIKFGLEMALLDLLNGGKKHIFCRDLSEIKIPINGLVWMGDVEFMKQQIADKLDQGFRCIKLKIGNLDFEKELAVIKELRKVSEELIIRLDANGAFQTNEVLFKLKALSQFNIHSIEQPILPMQPEAMEIVCQKSQIPIALDEELIWVNGEQERMNLIQELKPHYLVLKPTLHGGFSIVKNWIELAEMHGIGWWVTSYLESNIGLNAIAQFASLFPNDLHHGLGTGGLYHNNIISPIQIDNGFFKYAKSSTWGDVGL
jgi:o-succinylbenzoate synthase